MSWARVEETMTVVSDHEERLRSIEGQDVPSDVKWIREALIRIERRLDER